MAKEMYHVLPGVVLRDALDNDKVRIIPNVKATTYKGKLYQSGQQFEANADEVKHLVEKKVIAKGPWPGEALDLKERIVSVEEVPDFMAPIEQQVILKKQDDLKINLDSKSVEV